MPRISRRARIMYIQGGVNCVRRSLGGVLPRQGCNRAHAREISSLFTLWRFIRTWEGANLEVSHSPKQKHTTLQSPSTHALLLALGHFQSLCPALPVPGPPHSCKCMYIYITSPRSLITYFLLLGRPSTAHHRNSLPPSPSRPLPPAAQQIQCGQMRRMIICLALEVAGSGRRSMLRR